MLIHPDSIAQLKEAINITDVVSDYVVLKKRGQNQMGLCPFHQDKSPSFSVNEPKQLYHCFGCGAGGDVLHFLQTINKQGFQAVVLDLAQRYNVELQGLNEEKTKQLIERLTLEDKLREVMAVATNYYLQQLKQPENRVAFNYLLKRRELTSEIIARFQLGYAPHGWENLYQYLVHKKRYSTDLVLQAGLIIERESGGGYYDRFRDRIIIPIHDMQGRVIALGSRTFTNEEPKYLHSPETPLFNKSKVLYGLNQAAKSIETEDKVIIVEGYFDVIALHQRGITNAVASLGTALTQQQVNSALKYTKSKTIILNFDGDAAGIKASEKGIDTLETLANSSHAQIKILTLPGKGDADEYLKANYVESYQSLVNSAPLWIEWLINQLLVNKDLAKPDDFQSIAKQMTSLLANLVDSDLQSYYLSYCAEVLAGGNSALTQSYIEKFTSRINKPIPSNTNIVTSPGFIPTPSLEILRVYVQSTELRENIKQAVNATPIIFFADAERKLWLYIKDFISGAINLEDVHGIPPDIKAYVVNPYRTDTTKVVLEDILERAIAYLHSEAISSQQQYYLTRWEQESDPELADHYHHQWKVFYKKA